jgi:predicted 3-demethylubiquinone-9 3-methyltransferase (glyoxalase superfamily)
MQKITPFLWFDKETEEAMNFYVDVFNRNPEKKMESKIVSLKRYPEGPLEGPMKGFEGKVLTGIFELEGHQYMALDGGPIFKPNESVSFLVDCKNQEEIDYFWDALTKEGQESQCGWLKDKYGFSWQIVPDMEKWLAGPDSEGSKKALHVMLGMKKIIIADLEKAYNG